MSYSQSQLIHLCRADPNAFIEYVLGVQQGGLHVELQQALSDHEDVGAEFPRGHGNTVQIGGRCAWEIGHNPEILINVVQATDDDAVNFVTAVRSIMESPRYAEVFPEIERDPRKWGNEALTVKRKGVGVKDPTISAQPIFGNAGKRSDILIFDDICNLDNSVRQPAKREQVKQAYQNTWLPTLKKNGRCWRVFTPWHVDDCGALWKRDKTIKMLSYPVIGTERSPWPEAFDADRLKKFMLQMGPTAYARAFNLIPISAEEQVFFPNSIRASFYDPATWFDQAKRATLFDGARIIIATDFAYTEKEQIGPKKNEPDWSVIMPAAITRDGHVYVLDFWRGRVKFTETFNQLNKMVAAYKPEAVLLEDVGAQRGTNDIIESSLGAPIIKLPRTVDKFNRAIEAQPIVEQGRFHLPGAPGADLPGEKFIPVFQEMTEFPFSKNDDATDCAVDLINQVRKGATGFDVVVHTSKYLDPLLVSTHFMEPEKSDHNKDAPDMDADPDDIADFLANLGYSG